MCQSLQPTETPQERRLKVRRIKENMDIGEGVLEIKEESFEGVVLDPHGVFVETEVEVFDVGAVFEEGFEDVFVKVETGHFAHVGTVAFEDLAFLAAHPDSALFPKAWVKVTIRRKLAKEW